MKIIYQLLALFDEQNVTWQEKKRDHELMKSVKAFMKSTNRHERPYYNSKPLAAHLAIAIPVLAEDLDELEAVQSRLSEFGRAETHTVVFSGAFFKFSRPEDVDPQIVLVEHLLELARTLHAMTVHPDKELMDAAPITPSTP